jgi:hypothetical protein
MPSVAAICAAVTVYRPSAVTLSRIRAAGAGCDGTVGVVVTATDFAASAQYTSIPDMINAATAAYLVVLLLIVLSSICVPRMTRIHTAASVPYV